MKLISIIPFSYSWIIRHHLGSSRSILDVGCGDGALLSKIYEPDYKVIGIDLDRSDIKKAKLSNQYEKLIYGDIRNLQFADKSFDVVIASQVIEHLKKKEGLRLMKQMEKIARKKVIIATTNGFFPYEPFQSEDISELEIHKSGWEIEEMKDYKYKVYGQGAGFIHKPGGLIYRYRRLKNLLVITSLILAPLNYFFPQISAYIIAVKNLENNRSSL